jgi:hypothetical protein
VLDRFPERLAIPPPLPRQPSSIVRKTVAVDDPELSQANTITLAAGTSWLPAAPTRGSPPIADQNDMVPAVTLVIRGDLAGPARA